MCKNWKRKWKEIKILLQQTQKINFNIQIHNRICMLKEVNFISKVEEDITIFNNLLLNNNFNNINRNLSKNMIKNMSKKLINYTLQHLKHHHRKKKVHNFNIRHNKIKKINLVNFILLLNNNNNNSLVSNNFLYSSSNKHKIIKIKLSNRLYKNKMKIIQ